ncbi:MAG: RHS repeat protein [Bacteroidales bacterium]|nr:RHS repeat protein [Bacteroidales bacterium]
MRKLLLIFFFFFPLVCFSQVGGVRDLFLLRGVAPIVSPNAQAFRIFGNIPVSKFTGVPDIHIPLHEVVEGDIVLPIGLRYHIANRRVNSMPSWVGLGWTLDVGGVITRNMRGGGRDEDNTVANVGAFFYPRGFMFNHQIWNELGGDPSDHPPEYRYFRGNVLDPRYINMFCEITYEEIQILDHLPDEFTFNFMGYSGSFFYDIYSSRFVVNSEHDIKVKFNWDTDVSPLPNTAATLSSTEEWGSHIVRFRLITPDGMMYEFGGGSADCPTNVSATEISVPRQNRHASRAVTSAWFLTRITSPNGFEVNLHYSRGDIIANLYPHYERIEYLGAMRDPECRFPGEVITQCMTVVLRTVGGQVFSPVYLDSITFSTGRLRFARSVSQGLRYSHVFQSTFPAPTHSSSNHMNGIINGVWQKLDDITIFSLDQPIKRFEFSYIENPDERLKLRSVTEQALLPSGAVSVSKNPFVFQYNSSRLPPLCSRGSDHWGFANNFSTAPAYTGTGNDFHHRKVPTSSPSIYRAEILERIIWPTGGFTQFNYERHTYSKRVVYDRGSLHSYSTNQFAGGVRIRSIVSVDRPNQQNNSVREFIYTRESDGLSSGILAGTPFYFREFGFSTGRPIFVFNSNMLLPVGEAASGSHIGYSEVLEIERTLGPNDNLGDIVGSTRTWFTNFGTDIHGDTHMDRIAAGGINLYFANISNAELIQGDRSFSRGWPVRVRNFRSDGALVRETETRYQVYVTNRQARSWFPLFFFIPVCNLRGYEIDYQEMVVSRAIYRPISQTTRYFGTDALNPLITHVSYTYNAQRLISSQTTTNSEGQTIRTEFFYPSDFYNVVGSDHPIREMVRRNMISQPIEVRTSVDGRVVSGAVRTYGLFSGLILPQADFALELNTPVSNPFGPTFYPSNSLNYRQIRTYTSYDIRGNLQSFTDRNGVPHSLIWGYGRTRPIARIENAAWTQVSNALGGSLTPLIYSTDAAFIRSTLSNLRSHPSMEDAHVHSYTWHLPFGISSITDPSGMTTFYEYDDFGRLTTILDRNRQILEQIIYNYRTP